MSEHTKGLLALFRNGQSVGSTDGTGVCEVWPRDENGFPDSEGKANARRIVACVNACNGMDDAEVSRGLISTNHYSTVVNERNELKATNAELLDAAQEMAYLLENILRVGALKSNDLIIAESIRNVLPIHRAAIAKAKGEV